MNIPFTQTEYDRFTDFHCLNSNNCCDSCMIRNECIPYYEFDRGFALDDKKIINKGLRFAQKMNNQKFTVYKVEKTVVAILDTQEEAQNILKQQKDKNPNETYKIELTENS